MDALWSYDDDDEFLLVCLCWCLSVWLFSLTKQSMGLNERGLE